MQPRPLTSASNPRLKRARRLHVRRHREQGGLFLAEGPHVVEAALDARAGLREVFCTAEFLDEHAALAQRLAEAPCPVWTVRPALLESLAATEQPQGVVAIAEVLPDAAVPAVTPGLLGLALEGVADPGNVGVALRVAQAAGATLVLLGPGCCDRFNAKAVRASAGAVFAVPTLATDDLVGVLGQLRTGRAQVVVAEPRAARVSWAVDLCGPTVLVVGSEAHGVSEAVAALADERVAIPMPGGGESLNAGVAAAVLLYEALRQREENRMSNAEH